MVIYQIACILIIVVLNDNRSSVKTVTTNSKLCKDFMSSFTAVKSWLKKNPDLSTLTQSSSLVHRPQPSHKETPSDEAS